MTKEKIKSAIESLLFVWGDPLEAKVAAELFDMSVSEMVPIMRDLVKDYEERDGGLRIREIDKSFQLCTNPENDDYITKVCTPVKEKHLSQSALEVLAIIAYKQPVTKTQIDNIRGIKCDRVLEGLIGKGLVKELGRSTSIGRPYIFGTTKEFLKLFGFESLKDLPEIEEIDTLILEDDETDETFPNQIALPLGGNEDGKPEPEEENAGDAQDN